MKLNELLTDQQVIVQCQFKEEIIEFYSSVIAQDKDGIYISPYLNNNMPLELKIDMDDSVICNIFADDCSTGQRISWRNVSLYTVNKGSQVLYYIETSKFKELSNIDDRRKKERLLVRKTAQLYDANSGSYTTVVVNDVSESGIAFYTNANFKLSSCNFNIIFDDEIGEKVFNLNVGCSVVRTEEKQEHVLYGCSIKDVSKDFLFYMLLKKLSQKHYKIAV